MSEAEFCEYVEKNLKRFLPPGYEDAEIFLQEVQNPVYGAEMTLSVRREDKKYNPRVPMRQFYEKVRSSGDPDEATLEIAEAITRFHPPTGMIADLDIADYESLRDRLSVRLFDAEVSKDYLADKIWRPVGEFALVYRVEFGAKPMLTAAPVTKEIFDLWDADEEQLFRDTMETEERRRPARLYRPLDHFTAKNILEKPKKFVLQKRGQYVLTHSDVINGATVIARPGLLSRVADIFGCGYWVVPTANSEVMLAPDAGFFEASSLESILYEGNRNRNIVSREELLSDKVHYFDPETGELRYIHS